MEPPGNWIDRKVGRFDKVHPTIPIKSAIDWVIVGGESGPNARPMHPDWARSLKDQCKAAGVPFLFKQWGEWAPRAEWSYHTRLSKQCAIKFDGSDVRHDDAPQDVGGHRFEMVGKKAAGRLLDGREWNGVPA
jgi:protein gp37